MTEKTDKSAAAPVLEAADLDLVAQLADEGKDEAELWNELRAQETAKTPPDEGRTEAGEADAGGAQPDDAASIAAADASEEAGKADGKAGKAEPAAAAPAADQPDIWATATPEQRAAFEAARTEKDRLAHRVRSDDGRVAALQRRMEDLKKAAAAEEPGRQGDVKDPKEILAALKEEYPDIAEPLSQALEHLNGTVQELSQAEERRREAAATALTDTEAELVAIIDAETAKLSEKHPDMDAFLKDHGGDKLVAWLDDQPRRIRDAFAINANAIVNADAAIEFLDAYKQFVNPDAAPTPDPAPNPSPLNDKRRRQLDASATPSANGRKPVVSGIPEEGDPEMIWKMLREEERRKGVPA